MTRIGLKLAGIYAVIVLVAAAACGTSEDSTAADSTDSGNESPATSEGLPRANLSFEGFVYNQDPLSSEEFARFDEKELNLVGSTQISNTLAPGSDDSLQIYRPEDGGTGEVYTMVLGRSFENEDGRTISIDDEWVRWTVHDGEASTQ
jgi:hypothetical protein